jgi:hypothetical protein
MMKIKWNWIAKIGVAAALLALTACAMVPATGGSGAVTTTTQAAPPPAATEVPPTMAPTEAFPTPEISTAVAVSGTAISVLPGATQEAIPTTTGPQPGLVDGTLNITQASQGQTYHIKVGDRVFIYLGDDIYNWEVQITDMNVLSRVMGVMVIKGAQGLYDAKAPGTTQILANGDPLCRQSKPACMLPNRLISVTVIVDP